MPSPQRGRVGEGKALFCQTFRSGNTQPLWGSPQATQAAAQA